MTSQERILFLGPSGTYSEIALRTFFAGAEGIPCISLTEAFEKLVHEEATGALVPIENLIQGPVTETLDLLLEHRHQVMIESSRILAIRHALGALSENPAAVSAVYSHPQALRQCARFLHTNYPAATLCPMESTAAAIDSLKGRKDGNGAVIAAADTLEQSGLQIVAENISDEPNNQTRFLLLRRGDAAESFHEEPAPVNIRREFTTSIAIHPRRDRQGILFEILEIISSGHRVNMQSIHSRPDLRGGFVFFLDLEGALNDAPMQRCIEDLRRYCEVTTGATAELCIFGCYQKTQFFERPFSKALIAGGKGAMGQWFQRFFRKAGISTALYDIDTKTPLHEAAADADVILLSLPMSEAASFVGRLVPIAKSGQLIVENCSIKGCVHPALERLPRGVEVLGMHTMFGGDVDDLRGHNIIFTRTEASGELAQSFEDLFYKHGARTLRTAAKDHDVRTAVTQSLVQFVLAALGSALEASGLSRADLDPFTTPNLRVLLTALERVCSQTDALTLDLQQRNEEAKAVRAKLQEIVTALQQSLQSGDNQPFLAALEAGRKFLKSC